MGAVAARAAVAVGEAALAVRAEVAAAAMGA